MKQLQNLLGVFQTLPGLLTGFFSPLDSTRGGQHGNTFQTLPGLLTGFFPLRKHPLQDSSGFQTLPGLLTGFFSQRFYV